MATVPALLKSRWASRKHVGDAKPAGLVRIRAGHMDHLYQDPDMLPTTPGGVVEQVFPIIWKGNNGSPWQGQWVVDGPWINLTKVQKADWSRAFTANGTGTATVLIDNIAAVSQAGVGGAFHQIERGWYSPTRGVTVNLRPSLWGQSGWEDVFNGGYQIEIWEGYGQGADVVPVLSGSTWSAPSMTKTFVGLIEKCDMESHPDHITLSCRDFNVLITDQRCMGWNKAREIQSPVTFADRKRTQGEFKEFGQIVVSSGAPTSDPQLGAVWRSQTHPTSGYTEWIEVHLPQGHYQQFYIALPFDHQDMYVSLYARGGNCKMDTVVSVPNGWVDLSLGTVPIDGEPYIAKHPNVMANPSQRWSLGGHQWDLGDDSVLRISFNPLGIDNSGTPVAGVPTTTVYGAGTDSFYAFRFGTNPSNPPPGTPSVNALGWILVDDVADIIRMVLLWAGFHEFDVQDFGWTLQFPMSWGQDAFFVDIINDVLAQGNYVYFMDAPTDDDMSIGVPVFRPQSATKAPPRNMLTVRDYQLVEALQVEWDMSNAPYVMRFRGQVSGIGHTLFAVLVKRFMATYWPPWSGHDYTNLQGRNFQGTYPQGRTGGVRRHFSKTDADGLSIGLQSDTECLFACILAAVQYALQMVTGTFQMPGLPGVGLDQQVAVEDKGTGTNTRVWVASIQSHHTFGEKTSWHMSVGGSMLDTEDMDLIAQDYYYTYLRYVVYKVG